MTNILSNATLYIGIILGIYEVVAHAIPTINDITIVGNIAKILYAISDFLNVKKSA